MWLKIFISVSCHRILECSFVIACRVHLWENLSLIINTITRLGFKLILALSTRWVCQWRFTIIFRRMYCRLRRRPQWVLTMLWTIAQSFESGYRQAGHYFEGDSTQRRRLCCVLLLHGFGLGCEDVLLRPFPCLAGSLSFNPAMWFASWAFA